MGFSKMLGLLQIKSKGSIVLVNAGSFYVARGKDALLLFANIYLNEVDQYIKHKLKVKYYFRYMDDSVIKKQKNI